MPTELRTRQRVPWTRRETTTRRTTTWIACLALRLAWHMHPRTGSGDRPWRIAAAPSRPRSVQASTPPFGVLSDVDGASLGNIPRFLAVQRSNFETGLNESHIACLSPFRVRDFALVYHFGTMELPEPTFDATNGHLSEVPVEIPTQTQVRTRGGRSGSLVPSVVRPDALTSFRPGSIFRWWISRATAWRRSTNESAATSSPCPSSDRCRSGRTC